VLVIRHCQARPAAPRGTSPGPALC